MNISDLVPWKAGRGSQALERRATADPFYSMQKEFGRLFSDFYDLASWTDHEDLATFSPRVNVTERESEIEITAELPGLNENDIDVSLVRDVLTIKGEKKQELEEKEGNYYRVERAYGSFCRNIALPASVVETENVEAVFKNGVLRISLPKRAEAQEISRRITVKAG